MTADSSLAVRNAWKSLSTGAPVLHRDEQWPAHHVVGRLAFGPGGESFMRDPQPSFGNTRRYPASTSNSVRISRAGNVFRGLRADTKCGHWFDYALEHAVVAFTAGSI